MKSKKKIYPVFYCFISILFGIMMVGILLINLFISKKREFPCKKQFLLSNIELLIIGIIVLSLSIFLYNKFIKKYVEKLTRKQCNILLFVYFVITFVMQIYLIQKIFFLSGWDVGQLRVATDQIIKGLKLNRGNSYNYYFQEYPNNLFLLFIFVLISNVSSLLNIDAHLLMAIVGALSVNISIIMLVKIVGKVTKNKNICILSIFVGTLFLMFSPWIVIPYSDTYAMLFTISILYFYFNKENINKYIWLSILIILSLIGYKIKPTVIIVLIAIVIIEFWHWLFNRKKITFVKIIKYICSIVLGISVYGVVDISLKHFLGYEKNTAIEMPMTHFMMMGMNEKTRGIFFYDDVEYTMSYKGISNKKKANIDKIKQRMNDYGIRGYAQLLVDKSLINYDDGSFAWGIEGNFYLKIFNKNKSNILKEIYYNEGNYYSYFETFLQCMWILILVMSLFSIFGIKNYKLLTIHLAIIGITLFLLLFEARARYLLLYAPYYLIMFSIGSFNLLKVLKYKCKSKKYL